MLISASACTSRCSQFKVQYDKLVVAVGTDANTYGVPGVEANAFFLKEVEQAVQIRKRVMSNFETAALPSKYIYKYIYIYIYLYVCIYVYIYMYIYN